MGHLITRDALMRHLDIGVGDPSRVDVKVLDSVIASAEQTLKQQTGRNFVVEPAFVDGEDTGDAVTKTFRIGYRQTRVRIPDLRVDEGVELDGYGMTQNVDYKYDSYDGQEPSTSLYLTSMYPGSSPWVASAGALISITGRWGWTPCPDDLYEATLTLAARRYRRRDALFADQAEVGQNGGVTVDYRGGIPEDVMQTFKTYRLPRIALV